MATGITTTAAMKAKPCRPAQSALWMVGAQERGTAMVLVRVQGTPAAVAATTTAAPSKG